MLNLTDSEKESFYKSGAYFNDYEFNFTDLNFTITNETLHQESVTIKESICDSEDLQLGGCIASSCEFEVSELAGKELAGLKFTARLLVNDGKDAVVKMGKYRVDSAKRVNDKDYRKIVAYDALYDAQIDVSDWYNKVFYVVSEYEEVVAVGDIDDLWEHGDYYIDNSGSKPPWIAFFANGAVPEECQDTTYLDTSTGKLYEAQNTSKDEDNELYRWVEVYQCKRKTTTKRIYAKTTLRKLRESLLNHLNISFIEQDLINDDVTIERTFDASDTGEIIGTDILKYICELNAGFGKINRDGKFEVIQLTSAGLYPEETLYPSEDLYPEESNYELLSAEENEANYISVAYEEYETEAITGVIVKSNSDDVGQVVGTKDNAYMLTGNPLIYNKTSEDLTKIGQNIFAKIKGITYRPNTTTLEGLPYLETGDYYILTKNNDDVGSPIFTRTLAGVQALKDTYESKGNKLRVNEDTQTSEIMSLQSKTMKIQKGVDGLLIEVTDLDENTSSRFEQTASKIEAEVKRASNAEGELSGRITVTADQITQEVSRAKGAEGDLSSRITMTADDITAEVSRAKGAEGDLSSRITMTANEISSKVSKGDVCSEINQSAEQITLSGNRLVVNSTNFQLDGYGNATFSGNLSAATGTFAGDLSAPVVRFYGLVSTNNAMTIDGTSGVLHGSVSGDYASVNKVSTDSIYNRGTNKIKIYIDYDEGYGVILDKNSSNKYHFRPGSNDSLDCGSSSYKWDNIYATNGTIQTSDRNEKTNIADMTEQYAKMLIDGAMPKTYQMRGGKSGRTHAGMISQDLEWQLMQNGMSSQDFAGFIKYAKEDENGYPTGQFGYGIRYEEYIAPLIKYCQMLKRNLQAEREFRVQMQSDILNIQGEIGILKQQLK
jgi:hypothetical protein|nr:MAG TPA: Endo-N-acetylneuraminidase [Bacteriophage sp.]